MSDNQTVFRQIAIKDCILDTILQIQGVRNSELKCNFTTTNASICQSYEARRYDYDDDVKVHIFRTKSTAGNEVWKTPWEKY